MAHFSYSIYLPPKMLTRQTNLVKQIWIFYIVSWQKSSDLADITNCSGNVKLFLSNQISTSNNFWWHTWLFRFLKAFQSVLHVQPNMLISTQSSCFYFCNCTRFVTNTFLLRKVIPTFLICLDTQNSFRIHSSFHTLQFSHLINFMLQWNQTSEQFFVLIFGIFHFYSRK